MGTKKLAFPSFPSLSKALTEEQDIDVFSQSRPKHVPLWVSPLEDHDKRQPGKLDADSRQINDDQTLQHAAHRGSLPLASGPETSAATVYVSHSKQQLNSEEPILKTAHESSVIQLFYDLFFVANLTTFTAIHEVTDINTVISYVGFFSFLWFTWLQVSLFDVRFSYDSTFERVCKLLQFGVMIGMAVVAPKFSYTDDAGIEAFETLCLIIMASRLILAGQYAMVLLWLRDYKKARLPMLGLIATEFITAMVSLGIFFAFRSGSGDAAAIGWNFMFAIETIGMMAISGRVGFLSFRRTAIVERLGLLTLIILGEGVIGLTESIARASGNGFEGFTADIIFQITSSVAILYFLWILYFDQIETERMSTLHQQWWIILHFPYHVSVLLVVEGIAQLTVWRKLYDIFTSFYAALTVAPSENLSEFVQYLNETCQALYEQFPNSDVAVPDISGELKAILTSQGNKTLIEDEQVDIFVKGINWLADVFEVEIPEHFVELEATNEAAGYYGVLATYTTVFLYLFISAGLVLILLAALFWLGNRHKTPGEWISIGVRAVVGMALSMLAIMGQSLLNYVQSDSSNTGTPSNGGNYFRSEWMVPTVALVYLIVISLDKILVSYVRLAVRRRQQSTSDIPLVETTGTRSG